MLVKARHGLRVARDLPLRERSASSSSSSTTRPRTRWCRPCCRGEEFSIDVFCDLERALPQRRAAHDDRVEGRRVDQGHDDRRRRADRGRAVTSPRRIGLVGPANIQCFREPDGTHRITDINPRFGGAFPLPTAAGSRYPELALALAAGERPEPRLGDFRAGLYMTRFFSELVLSAGEDGTLEPFAEELPEPIAEP